MPRVTIYIDEPTLNRVKAAAAREQTSVSKWIAKRIGEKVESVYPAGYEALFGSLASDELIRPSSGHLAEECAKLDPALERASAEENISAELAAWPNYSATHGAK